MSIRTILFCAATLFLLFLGACRSDNKIVNIQAHWSSYDPKSIPLNIRQKEEEKGNLIINPSFEEGRFYRIDTLRLSFNLPGWKKTGENVFWTDIQKEGEFNHDEASNGNHAIKIVRRNADETDVQGEGIFSDYIKVIPGNYSLSMDLRLKNIESNLERQINHIYDAVNIRLFFFDKNKVLIKSNVYHPVYDRLIDNSFKATPISNFDYIKEMGWSRLLARSANFPFLEGYIPDDARYVRIFAGLKGTGIMWVDMVDFRFSNENFTFLEKTEALIDSTLDHSRLLIPEPHRAVNYQAFELVKYDEDGKGLKPLFLLPANANINERKIIGSLITNLKKKNIYSADEYPVVNKITSRDIESGRLIFSFGPTSLSRQYTDQLSEEEKSGIEQFCYLERIPSVENIVFISFSDEQGLFRAVNIVSQLFDNEKMIYHHYDITDFPDFNTRGIIIPLDKAGSASPSASEIDFLTFAGYNHFIFEPRGDDLNTSNFLSGTGKACKVLDAKNMTLGFLKKSFSFVDLKYGNLSDINGGGKDSLLNRKAIIKDAQNHAELIKNLKKEEAFSIIFSDQSLWNILDFGSVPGSIKMMRDSEFNNYLSLREDYWQELNISLLGNSMQIYLLPLISDNRTKNQVKLVNNGYFRLLAGQQNIFHNYLWMGPVLGATMVDDFDYSLYTSDNELNLILFDNTFASPKEEFFPSSFNSKYPGIMSIGSIFEPYNVKISMNAREALKSESIINIYTLSELSLIRLATAADYYWNVTDYDPFVSVWKILVNRYGKTAATELIYFNDLFYSIMNICIQLEDGGYNQKLVKSGEELIISLESRWETIKTTFPDNLDFLSELSDFKNRAISGFAKAKRHAVKAPSLN